MSPKEIKLSLLAKFMDHLYLIWGAIVVSVVTMMTGALIPSMIGFGIVFTVLTACKVI